MHGLAHGKAEGIIGEEHPPNRRLKLRADNVRAGRYPMNGLGDRVNQERALALEHAAGKHDVKLVVCQAIAPDERRGVLRQGQPLVDDDRRRDLVAGVLDLCQRVWQDQPLGPQDHVLSSDEKSALQVLTRRQATLPPWPEQPGHYEFEYERNGTLAYLAALDVFSGQVYGCVQDTTGIEPFGRLVPSCNRNPMPQPSVSSGSWMRASSHHPNTSPARLQAAHANLIAVHLPTHASWLNQIEVYFSIVQRKALTPMDLPDKVAVTHRILDFQRRYDQTAKPFRWNFTRADLQERLQTIADQKSKNL